MDPYMAIKPMDIEIVNDKTSHVNNIITNWLYLIHYNYL
jgi:hypothetical protein